MKTLRIFLSLLAGAALLAASNLNAATTDPVGYVSQTVNANADLRVGVPLNQSPTYSGSVDTVTSGTINVLSAVPDVTTEVHYVWVTSGTLLGNWYEVTGSTATSITVAEDLQTAGLAATDTFKVVAFWTLNSLFPDGGNIPISSDPFNPIALVLLNDVTLSGVNLAAPFLYFYYDGSQGGEEGWYQNGNLGAGVQGSTLVSPSSYISIRNLTASPVTVTITGTVPTYAIANEIVSTLNSRQDNQVQNPYPAGMTLSASDLVTDGVITSSSDPFNPVDLLFVFEATPTATNPAPDRVFFHYDGSAGGDAGWYENGNLGGGVQDGYELPSGCALIVRKASGSDSAVTWVPNLPYNLNN